MAANTNLVIDGIDRIGLRKDRKIFILRMFYCALLIGFSKALMRAFATQEGFNLMMVFAGVLFVAAIGCCVSGLGVLKRLCYVLYGDKSPKKYFILHTILVIMGFLFMGLFLIITLFTIWFRARKLLIKA